MYTITASKSITELYPKKKKALMINFSRYTILYKTQKILHAKFKRVRLN